VKNVNKHTIQNIIEPEVKLGAHMFKTSDCDSSGAEIYIENGLNRIFVKDCTEEKNETINHIDEHNSDCMIKKSVSAKYLTSENTFKNSMHIVKRSLD
jgi:hypothetical protein